MSHRDHLVQHIRNTGLVHDSTLHVIGVVSNPERFQTRVRHSRDWITRMGEYAGVKAYVVEAAFGDRAHEVIDPACERHLSLFTKSQCWIKESMINQGVRYLLPRDWRYMAWVDMDIAFRDPEWAIEAMHQLQHFPLIQPWQTSVDLAFRGRAKNLLESFGSVCQRRHHQPEPFKFGGGGSSGSDGHTGYAWACTRGFYERVGGLVDFAIFGSGDWHMAYAAVGHGAESLAPPQKKGGYLRRVLEWQERAMPLTHGEIGYSYGHIEHSFHGSAVNRRYASRWKVLVEHDFDPDTDLVWDEQGLVQLRGNKPQLEIAIREHNRLRLEDDVRDE